MKDVRGGRAMFMLVKTWDENVTLTAISLAQSYEVIARSDFAGMALFPFGSSGLAPVILGRECLSVYRVPLYDTSNTSNDNE